MASLSKKIKQFNAGRNPKVLPLKYQAMRTDAFSFYRGTCHLFYADLPAQSCLHASPATWLCGDLHLENFGCYQADDGLPYLNINDFDESVLAPCLFDISRILTSILLAADNLKINDEKAMQLCKRFLKTYVHTLRSGTAQWLDDRVATGFVKTALQQAKKRRNSDLLKSRTAKNTHQTALLFDEKRLLKIDTAQKEKVTHAVEEWAKQHDKAAFYQVLDVGYRIAGTGSLGLERYLVLTKGSGKEARCLLDIKIANTSCLNPLLKTTQPKWKNEAQRICQIQQHVQIFPIARLNSLMIDKKQFVIKGLQSSQNKIDFVALAGKVDILHEVMDGFAQITAWNQLRSGGWHKSATVDELVDFAKDFSEWKHPLLDESVAFAQKMKKNYQRYCKAYDKGYFNQ